MMKFLLFVLLLTSCGNKERDNVYVIGRLKLENEHKWFVANVYNYMYVINYDDKYKLFYQSNDIIHNFDTVKWEKVAETPEIRNERLYNWDAHFDIAWDGNDTVKIDSILFQDDDKYLPNYQEPNYAEIAKHNKNFQYSTSSVETVVTTNITTSGNVASSDDYGYTGRVNGSQNIYKMPNGEDKIWDGANWVNPQ